MTFKRIIPFALIFLTVFGYVTFSLVNEQIHQAKRVAPIEVSEDLAFWAVNRIAANPGLIEREMIVDDLSVITSMYLEHVVNPIAQWEIDRIGGTTALVEKVFIESGKVSILVAFNVEDGVPIEAPLDMVSRRPSITCWFYEDGNMDVFWSTGDDKYRTITGSGHFIFEAACNSLMSGSLREDAYIVGPKDIDA